MYMQTSQERLTLVEGLEAKLWPTTDGQHSISKAHYISL